MFQVLSCQTDGERVIPQRLLVNGRRKYVTQGSRLASEVSCSVAYPKCAVKERLTRCSSAEQDHQVSAKKGAPEHSVGLARFRPAGKGDRGAILMRFA